MFAAASSVAFLFALSTARKFSAQVSSATSAPDEIPTSARFFLSENGRAGYGITAEGTLISVFSLDRGKGNAIVSDAIANGATNLDCFDGYLPTLYARHGFTVTHREANWTPGGPDVVFMSLTA